MARVMRDFATSMIPILGTALAINIAGVFFATAFCLFLAF
jgi:hypothetical protein